MKISELIEELEEAMREGGDVEVRGNARAQYGYCEEGEVSGVTRREDFVFICASCYE